MRSFFKKPDWAKSDNNPGQSAEFYRRSEQVYTDIISRKPEEDEDDDESDKEEKQDLCDDRLQEPQSQLRSPLRGSKRRRISREESVPSSTSTRSDSERYGKGGEDQEDIKETIHPIQQSPAAISHTQAKTPPREVSIGPPPAAVVELYSDSDERPLQPKSQPERPPQPPTSRLSNHDLDDDEDNDDDTYAEEEYPELARKARERARQLLSASAGSSGLHTDAAEVARTTQYPNYDPTTQSTHNTPDRQSQPTEPIVKILITSDIPNTSPLIVQRRLNQDLRDVRRAWCSRQGFSDDMAASVFLTWKGRRLFDVTTCKSLGVQQEKEKGLLLPLPIRDYYDDDEYGSNRDDGSIEVHMEAVTDKLFEEKKRQAIKVFQRESGRSGAAGGNNGDEDEEGDDDDEGDEAQAELEAKENQEVLLLTLKSPGVGDLKIRVRPKTHISSIIRSFREKRGVSAHRTVQLIFDGDRLDPDSIVGDNDMADLDLIDVRIK